MVQYESDACAIARVVEAAQESGEEIDHGTARAIAAGYNDYRTAHFVSTGYMPQGDAQWLMDAIRRGVDTSTLESDRPALEALQAYLLKREGAGDTGRVPGWSGMWVTKHADLPHESGSAPDCPACELCAD